jgi:hypothetical protein
MAGTKERLGTIALALIVAAAAGVVAVGVVRAKRNPALPASAPDATAVTSTTHVDEAGPTAAPPLDAGVGDAHEPPRAVDAGTPCEALASVTRDRLAEARAAHDGGCPAQGLDGFSCVDAHGVTWGWRVARASVTRSGDTEFYCATTFAAELVREADGGTTATPTEDVKYDWTTRTERRELTALADYDGDGLDEVLAVHRVHFHEGVPTEEARLLTFKGGAITPYAPAKGLVIEEATDLDGDGRPDLVTRGPYGKALKADGMGNQWPIAPVIFAAHSLADGTFSRDDDVARARAHKSCPARPALTLAGDESDALTLVCSRLWGVPAPPLLKEIQTVCAEPDASPTPSASCRSWEETLAKIDPPFRLDRHK